MANISVDLGKIRANYQALHAKTGHTCEVSAVVKANAYGLGMEPIAMALIDAGCRSFYVATIDEAVRLREASSAVSTPDITIASLSGFNSHHADIYIEHDIIPVLNNASQLENYQRLARKNDVTLPAMIHVDTGMNRLGFKPETLKAYTQNKDAFNGLTITTILSHFASADDITSPLTQAQYESFMELSALFPLAKRSLCNSSGLFRDDAYHLDNVRPGMALYGLNPTPWQENPMQSTLSISGEILQIHSAKIGGSIGYNETYRIDEDSTLAIIDIGYADGMLRSLSNTGYVYWGDTACPIRGRISMDYTIIDITDIPEANRPNIGDDMIWVGEQQSIDTIADHAGTSGYEILTRLGNRFTRRYINA